MRFSALLLASSLSGVVALASGAEDGTPDHPNLAVATWSDVGAPLGSILLIRRGADLCGVKFTAARRGHDAHAQTIFDSGEESFYAEYDWYSFTADNGRAELPAISGHHKLAQYSLKGIGRLAFQTGDTHVRCGPFPALRWMYPTRVTLFAGGRPEDQGISMAPTNWTAFTEVKPNDPRLKWFGYDEQRKVTWFRVE